MSELFYLQNIEYNIRPQSDFTLGAVSTTNYGLQPLRYFAQKIWNMISVDIKNVNTLSDFTLKIQPLMLVFVIYAGLICQVGHIN